MRHSLLPIIIFAAVLLAESAEAQHRWRCDPGYDSCVLDGRWQQSHYVRYYPTTYGTYPRVLGACVEVAATQQVARWAPDDQIFLFYGHGIVPVPWPSAASTCCFMHAENFLMQIPWDRNRQAYVAEILIDEGILPYGFDVTLQVYGVLGAHSAFLGPLFRANCQAAGLLSGALIFNEGHFCYS